MFFGDFNFWINLPYKDGVEMATWFNEDDRETLLEHDQLNIAMKNEELLEKFTEADIYFRPTYKYNPGENHYDTSKKKRVPAWCDRIVWIRDEKFINPHSYERKEISVSDHWPVLGFYTITTYDHDKAKMI